MSDLIAEIATAGLMSFETEGCALEEHVPERITWIAPFKGQMAAVSEAMERDIGCPFPEPNRMTVSDHARAISSGPQEALVLGRGPDTNEAAVVDQSDGWVVLHLSGAMSRDVLARLTPVDLRPTHFEVGHTARTLIGHMTGSLSRLDADIWEIIVFRSMTKTAIHDIERAMKAVTARQSL